VAIDRRGVRGRNARRCERHPLRKPPQWARGFEGGANRGLRRVAPAGSSNRLAQPCIRMPVPSRRTAPLSVGPARPCARVPRTIRPLAASARCAGATMHLDDAVLRRTGTTPLLPRGSPRFGRKAPAMHLEDAAGAALPRRPSSGWTQQGPGWEPAIAARASLTCALFSPSGSIFCASCRRPWHSPRYPRAHARSSEMMPRKCSTPRTR
jgi:hypothetical protein